MRRAVPWLGLLCGATLAVLLGLETPPGPTLGRGELVERVLDEVERTHVRTVDGDELLHEGLDRMLRSLDRNSRYFPPSEVAAFEQDTEGYIVGIGIVVGRPEAEEDPDAAERGLPRITGVVEGGPAAGAGLRPGDRLLTAEGTSLAHRSVEETTSLIKGPEGSLVALEVESADGLVRAVRVLRQRVEIPSIGEVALYTPADGEPVGLVRLLQFQPRSTDEVEASVAGLISAGARSVVLDFRGNGGGLLQQAIGIASLFLDGGEIVVRTVGRARTTESRETPRIVEELFRAAGPPAFPDIPLVVLVDGNSASASEIVAAALRDHRRAPLVGEESYGKWTVQDVIPLGPGARDGIVKITTQSFHPPTGERVHFENGLAQGILPDVTVTVDNDTRALLSVWWSRRHFERINDPLAVERSEVPSASQPPEELPPADPILARAVDLCRDPSRIAGLFVEPEPEPEPVESAGSER